MKMHPLQRNRNLICLFGPSGCGKTRLLRSMEERLPPGRVLRTGAETIVEEMSGSCRQLKTLEFIEKYRAVENLLVDNLWVLAGRPATASWLAEILGTRRGPGQLTVLASDLSPQDWTGKSRKILKLLAAGEKVWLAPPPEMSPGIVV